MKQHILILIAGMGLTACNSTPEQHENVIKQSVTNVRYSEQGSRPDVSKPPPKLKTVKKSFKKSHLTPEVLEKLMLAEIAGQRGKLAAAVESYLLAARLSRDPAIAERATRIAIYARNDSAAMESGRLWVQLRPESTEAHQVMAALLVRHGKVEQAISHFEKILELDTHGKHQSFMLITSLLSKERDKHVALDIMKRLISGHPNNPSAYFAYANLSILLKEYKQADKAISRALELKPGWTKALILKATVLTRLQRKQEVLLLLEQALSEQPANYKLRLYYARKLVDHNLLKQAYQQFHRVYTDNKKNYDVLYAMGLLANQLKQQKRASKHFNTLLQKGSHRNEANYYLGQIEEGEGKYEQAIDYFSKVYGSNYEFEAKIHIVLLLGKLGKVDEARERVKHFKITNPHDRVRLYVAEGEVLRENKRYQAAYQLYANALNVIPDDVQLLYARALIAEKLEQVDTAIRDLKKIISLDPRNAQALNALGYTLVDKTKRVHEGLDYIKQAYKLQPEDAAITDSLGWGYYRLGKLKQAKTYLRKAFTSFNDPEIAAHLGEVLWVSGEQQEALKIWENALREKPQHETLLEVMKRLVK